jgi:hypothetical protein
MVYYPMIIENGQVYVIDYAKVNKTTTRMYYIFEGETWEGLPVTENIDIE